MSTLEELVDLGKLSVRAYNTCHIGGIYTIKELVNFYNRVGSFLKIRNCGLKTENELISLAKQYKGIDIPNGVELNEAIEEENYEIIVLNDGSYVKLTYLTIQGTPLSDSAKYVCLTNSINTSFDLISLRADHKEFTQKTEKYNYSIVQELTEYCFKYQILRQDFDISVDFQQIKWQLSLYFNIEVKSKTQALLEETHLDTLSEIKKNLIEQLTYLHINKLSERAKNSIISAIDNSSPLHSFEKLFIKDFNFNKIKNVGSNTVIELSELKNKWRDFTYEIIRNDSNIELEAIYISVQLQNKFDIDTDSIKEITDNIIICGYVPIFNIISILLEKKVIFDELKYEIFKHCSDYTIGNEEKTLENIAQSNNLSRERIRQIRSKIADELKVQLEFIRDLKIDLQNQYFLNTEKDFIYLQDDYVEKLNSQEDVMFSNHFYLLVFSILMERDYTIIGYWESIKPKDRYIKDKSYKNSYLIKNHFVEVFDFRYFLNDVYTRQSEKITEEYSLPFAGYLTKFYFNKYDLRDIDRVKSIAEEILAVELEVLLDIDDCIVFERNEKKQMHEYVIEVLEQSGKLMHFNEICKEIIYNYPNISLNTSSLRNYIQREKNIFIFINRQSTYGLKKWENEYEYIKGGTIRDIVEEFLDANDEPKHIYEIMQYLGKYRETNEKSVMTNLKLDESNRFIIFEGGFVGLKSRKYDESQIQFKPLVGGWFLKSQILEFNNKSLEVVIQNLASKYSVKPVQIRNVIVNKINEGELELDENNYLHVPYSQLKSKNSDEFYWILNSKSEGKKYEIHVDYIYDKESKIDELEKMKKDVTFLVETLKKQLRETERLSKENFEYLLKRYLNTLGLIKFKCQFKEVEYFDFSTLNL